MTKEQAKTLQNADLVIMRRSQKTYRVSFYNETDGTIQARQLRDGKPYGATRALLPGAVERLSPANAQHPASPAGMRARLEDTQALGPTTISTTADKLVSALTLDAVVDEWQHRHGTAAHPTQPARRSDGDEGDRLARRVVRAAERWQRGYPCPPVGDQPELHGLWKAVERLLEHDRGVRPEPRAERVARAQACVPAPLTEHADRLTTTADALERLQAEHAVGALQRRGFDAGAQMDPDGGFGITIWL